MPAHPQALASAAAVPAALRTRRVLQGPLWPALLRLAAPHVIGLFAMTAVIGHDGCIIGRLGADALMRWPLAGSVARLAIVALGGWLRPHVLHTTANGLLAAVARAACCVQRPCGR